MYSIDRAVHLARLASFHPPCQECRHRDDVRLFAGRRKKQLGDVHRRAAAERPIFASEGVAGDYLNQIGPKQAERIGRAFGQYRVEPLAADESPQLLVGQDGRAETADLAAAAIEGLRWAGCSVADVGVATAPALAMAASHSSAAGFLLAGNLSGEPREVAFSFWGPRSEPLSAPGGLDAVEHLYHSPAPRPRRTSGGVERLAIADDYLNALHDYYHALRPLRVVVQTTSPAVIEYLNRLTANVAVEIDWLTGSSPFGERLVGRIRDTRAHFGAAIDGIGESCRVLDQCGKQVAIDSLAALIRRELQNADSQVLLSRVATGPSRQATWRMLQNRDMELVADDQNRIWYPAPLPCPDALRTLTLLFTLLSRGDNPLSELAQSAIT